MCFMYFHFTKMSFQVFVWNVVLCEVLMFSLCLNVRIFKVLAVEVACMFVLCNL